jgi:hypothetical protein
LKSGYDFLWPKNQHVGITNGLGVPSPRHAAPRRLGGVLESFLGKVNPAGGSLGLR